MSDDSTLDPSRAAPREDMISTAVRFLQNPQVTQSALSQKRTFLEKKGLTTEEIDQAVARAGVSDTTATHQTGADVILPHPAPYTPGVQPLISPPVPLSTWTKVKDFTATAVIVGGLAYGIYKFYKKYIMPVWFGPSPEERQLAAIHKSITELQTSIGDTLKYMKDMQSSISTQQAKIDDISFNSNVTRTRSASEENGFVKEVKDEIKSLKGLLLSRKQFPPTPASQPVLPAWQLAVQKTEEKIPIDSDNTETPAQIAGDISAGQIPPGDIPAGDIADTIQNGMDLNMTANKDSRELVNGYLENGLDTSETQHADQSVVVIDQSLHLSGNVEHNEQLPCATIVPETIKTQQDAEISS